jgi:DNA-directed RNA polymerase subunit K/omega
VLNSRTLKLCKDSFKGGFVAESRETRTILTSPPESRLNKYELIIVAGKEARRLNELARQQGRDVKGRVTHVAMRRYLEGDIQYRYED